MLNNYIVIGVWTFINLIPAALIIFCAVIGGKFLVKRKFEFKPLKMLCEFAWILIVLSILKITGIIGGDFSTTSIFNGNAHISFNIFEEGLSMAAVLNIILFIPFGFLSPIVFNKLKDKRIYVFLIGIIFSLAIEFLQTFTGRFVELADVLTNTLGTFIGYEICMLFSRLKHRK